MVGTQFAAKHRPNSMRTVAVAIVSALLVSVTCCHAQGRMLQLPTLGAQVRVPADWQVVRVIEGRGLSIGKPGSATETLDIVAWEPVADAPSATAAAKAHEQVLAIRFPYSRESEQIVTTAAGDEAATVLGSVSTPEGEKYASLFTAFLMGGRYMVIGTFCTPDQVSSVRREFFDDAVATFSASGAALPGSGLGGTLAGPVEVTPEPTKPEPTIPGPPKPEPTIPGPPKPEPTILNPPKPEPTIPEPPNPEPTIPDPPKPWVLTERNDPLGFSLNAPANWGIRVVKGCIITMPPERPLRYGVAVWPLLRTESAPVAERALAASRGWAQALGANWKSEQTRLASGVGLANVETGSLVLSGVTYRAVAVFAPGEQVDMLQVAFFVADTPQAVRTNLARIVAGFILRALSVSSPATPTGGPWTGRDGSIQSRTPSGWIVIGGVTLYNDFPAIQVQAQHPDSGASFIWRQPSVPFFKDLTEALSAAGWRDGSEFPPDQGIEPLALARRPSALAAARQMALIDGVSTVASSGVDSSAASLLPGAEGAFANAAGPEQQATALYAIAEAPEALGKSCWMASTLYFRGPKGSHEAAGAALREFITNAELKRGWPATSTQRETLADLLARAKEAAKALPEAGPELPEATALQPVLTKLVDETQADVVQVRAPRQAAALWERATSSEGAQEFLPELLAE